MRPARSLRAFTIVEVIVVMVVIALLVAILIPVLARAKEAAKKSACVSNLQQLGVALALYASDSDDSQPIGLTPPSLFGTPVKAGLGWGGRIMPFVKNTRIFRCPDDQSPDTVDSLGTASAVSYALNLNTALSPRLSDATAPSKTVWLFEVVGDQAHLDSPNEGAGILNKETDQMSAIGDGVTGSIVSTIKPWTGAGQGVLTFYATGRMDNWNDPMASDQYANYGGRHSDGSNFLAMDSHAVWSQASQVSAGGNNPKPQGRQSATGCSQLAVSFHNRPCAEAAGLGVHGLTFSIP